MKAVIHPEAASNITPDRLNLDPEPKAGWVARGSVGLVPIMDWAAVNSQSSTAKVERVPVSCLPHRRTGRKCKIYPTQQWQCQEGGSAVACTRHDFENHQGYKALLDETESKFERAGYQNLWNITKMG